MYEIDTQLAVMRKISKIDKKNLGKLLEIKRKSVEIGLAVMYSQKCATHWAGEGHRGILILIEFSHLFRPRLKNTLQANILI